MPVSPSRLREGPGVGAARDAVPSQARPSPSREREGL